MNNFQRGLRALLPWLCLLGGHSAPVVAGDSDAERGENRARGLFQV